MWFCVPLFGRTQDSTFQKKEVRKYVIDYPKKADSLGVLNWIDNYDQRGNLTKQIIFVEAGESCDKSSSPYLSLSYAKYNSFNEPTEIITYLCGDSFPTERIKYSYIRNHKKQLTEEIKVTFHQFKPDEKVSVNKQSTKFLYTDFGEVKCVIEDIGRTSTYLYNKDKQCNYIFSKTAFTPKPNIYHYTYDKNGNCISYLYKGRVSCHLTVTSWKKKFNAENQMIYEEHCNGAGCCENKYAYDEKGRIKTRVSSYSIEEYAYNAHGDLSQTTVKHTSGEISRIYFYTYVYY